MQNQRNHRGQTILNVNLLLLAFILTSLQGCGRSNNPDSASDDEIFSAVASGEGQDPQRALEVWHRRKDESPAAYDKSLKAYRNYIKYFGGDAGTTTIDEYVEKRSALRKKDEQDVEANRLARQKTDAEHAAKQAQEEAVNRVRAERTAEITDKYAAADRELDAEYKRRSAISLEESSIAAADIAKRREQLRLDFNAELQKLNSQTEFPVTRPATAPK